MEPLIAFAAVIALIFWGIRRNPDYRDRPPADGLSPDPDLEDAVRTAVGALPGGLWLSLSRCQWTREADGRTEIGTRLAVSGLCRDIMIRPGGGGDMEVGDGELDGRLMLMGPPPLLRAMLDAPARRALRALIDLPQRQASIKVLDGELRIDVADRDAAALTRMARVLAAAAQHLRAPDDVPSRLAANAYRDENAGVRLASLQTLLREFPDHPRTREAARSAREDADGEVRLAAARVTGGPEGRALLLALAGDMKADDATSAQALDALRDATAAELRPILQAAQRGGTIPWRPFTARACVEALGRLGEEALPLLHGPLRSGHEAVARAAIRAVAHIGGPAAVMPLQSAVEHHRGELQRAAETALGDVQAQLVGTPGQLSLTGADAGQVSLAQDAAGQVSLPAKPAQPDTRPRKPLKVEQ